MEKINKVKRAIVKMDELALLSYRKEKRLGTDCYFMVSHSPTDGISIVLNGINSRFSIYDNFSEMNSVIRKIYKISMKIAKMLRYGEFNVSCINGKEYGFDCRIRKAVCMIDGETVRLTI